MVNEVRATAPYAPVDNVLRVIHRLRDQGLPDVLNLQQLQRVGIAEGNAPRTLAALRFLGLVGEDGQRTPLFDRLGRASTDEYPHVLEEILRDHYDAVFTIVDPAQADDIALRDAFRHYEPRAQAERMITLFRGLCREAQIIASGPVERRPRARRAAQPRPAPPIRRREEEQQAPADEEMHEEEATPFVDYRPLTSLMQQLPKDGRWTQARRDRWMRAFEANVDFIIEIVNEGGDA